MDILNFTWWYVGFLGFAHGLSLIQSQDIGIRVVSSLFLSADIVILYRLY